MNKWLMGIMLITLIFVAAGCSSSVALSGPLSGNWDGRFELDFSSFLLEYLSDLYGSEEILSTAELVDDQQLSVALKLGSPQAQISAQNQASAEGNLQRYLATGLKPQAVLNNLVERSRGALNLRQVGQVSQLEVRLNRSSALALTRFYAGDEIADTLDSYTAGSQSRAELIENLVWAFEGYRDAAFLEDFLDRQRIVIIFPQGSKLSSASTAAQISTIPAGQRVEIDLMALLSNQDILLSIELY